jgi:phage-related protein
MGWFSDLWDGIKSTASNVWNGVKSVASTVYDTVRKPVDLIASAGKYINKIPVLGTVLKPVTSVAEGARDILDQAKSVADVGKAIGLRDGGLVKRKYYQA